MPTGGRLLAAVLLVGGIGLGNPAPALAGNTPVLAFDDSRQALLKADGDRLSRSEDGGRRWAPLSLPPAAGPGQIAAVAVTAGDKGVVYVAGPGFGVLRSDDAGQTWSARTAGLPAVDVVALATHAEQADTVYAYIANHGFFRSQDGGQRWQLMDAGPRGGIARFVHSNMAGSMQTGWLFAATAQGVRRAMDCFCGWRDAGQLGRAVVAVAYDPRQAKRVYATTEDGLFLSENGGERWTRLNAPAVFQALIVSPAGALFAAAEGTLYRSDDDAKTWVRIDA